MKRKIKSISFLIFCQLVTFSAATYSQADVAVLMQKISEMEKKTAEIEKKIPEMESKHSKEFALMKEDFNSKFPEIKKRISTLEEEVLYSVSVSMKAPINFTLPPGKSCKSVLAIGMWSGWADWRSPTPCFDNLPIKDGVVTYSFDSHYPDNQGSCTFVFKCLPK